MWCGLTLFLTLTALSVYLVYNNQKLRHEVMVLETKILTTVSRAENPTLVSPTQAMVTLLEPKGRKIFIDLGANCGNSYKKLRNERLINGSEWIAYLWEANPQMVHHYLNDLASKDKRVRVVANAAWVEKKKMQFFLTKGQEDITDKKKFKAHQCNPKSIYQPSGASSLFSGNGTGGAFDIKRKSRHIAGKSVEIQALDFNQWLRELKLTKDDFVVLKIDIEGAEIPVLHHLLDNGGDLACYISQFMIEWHSWMLASNDKKTLEKTKSFEKSFLAQVGARCGTQPSLRKWH